MRDIANFPHPFVATSERYQPSTISLSLRGLAEIGLYRGRRYFEMGSGYLDTFAEFSLQDLSAQFKEKDPENAQSYVDDIAQGTAPNEENFSVFTFNDKFIKIYFQQYQVASYAAGEQMVSFPRQ